MANHGENAGDEIVSQYMCCSEEEWEPVADLRYAAGVDFGLRWLIVAVFIEEEGK